MPRTVAGMAPVLALAVAWTAAASEPADPTAMTLREVVAVTLKGNTAIRLAHEQLRFGAAEVRSAEAAFDPVLSASVAGSHSETPSFLGGALYNSESDDLEYVVGLSRRFRSGFRLDPSIGISQTAVGDDDSWGAATVSAALVVPLGRDRGGTVYHAAEKAARAAYEADRRNLDHEKALRVYDAVATYWSYVHACRQLDILQSAEQRALRLVDETRELVRAEERPEADLNQMDGNAATRRIDRVNAEQVVVSARWGLGLVMGLETDEILALPVPTDEFPDVPHLSFEPEAVDRLVAAALERRADLDAAEHLISSADLLVQSAESNGGPAVDLSVTVGYQGAAAGPELETFGGSLHENVSGASGTVALGLLWPLRDAAAEGLTAQRESQFEQQTILERDLTRQIAAGVREASEALRRSALAASAAGEAVAFGLSTLDNEREKNRLGFATLFDVILAEEQLTSALLSEVTAKRNYVVALATLRFASGVLLEGRGDGASVDTGSLTAPPAWCSVH